MKTMDIQRAKASLSQRVSEAAAGDPIVITKARKASVKVVSLIPPAPSGRTCTGFGVGQITVPTEFDRGGADDISHLSPAYHPGPARTG